MDNRQLTINLSLERKNLLRIIQEAEKRIRKAPEGNVRVIKHKKGFQYYLRTDSSDKNGTYIPASEFSKSLALVQKKYDQKIVKIARRQSSAIERFLNCYDPEIMKGAYITIPDALKSKILPAEISDEEYIKRWEEDEYEPKPFTEGIPEHFTDKGERVRSKSEVLIADSLKQAGIPYKYECPLNLGGIVIHPDFTILRPCDRSILYWEHLGRMEDPNYCLHAIQRVRQYEAEEIFIGQNLIITMESERLPVNRTIINRIIRTYCGD